MGQSLCSSDGAVSLCVGFHEEILQSVIYGQQELCTFLKANESKTEVLKDSVMVTNLLIQNNCGCPSHGRMTGSKDRSRLFLRSLLQFIRGVHDLRTSQRLLFLYHHLED